MSGVRNSKKSAKNKRPKKGVRYIAQKLRKYYPKRYTTYKDALTKAKTIKSELDLRSDVISKKVNLKNIFSIERIPRGSKKKISEPKIPEKFYDAFNYFEIVDVSDEIQQQLPDDVFVESKISKEDLPLLQGMTNNSDNFYQLTGKELQAEYFLDFINYGNQLQALTDNKYPMFYTFLPPIRKNGKWVMYLVSSDEEGIKCDFGFDPENPTEPTEIFTCADNYEDMPYNSLRIEVKKRGFKAKTPTKKQLIEILRTSDKKNQPEPKKPTKQATEIESVAIEKEKTKQKQADVKIIAEKNKSKELDLKQQELDLRKQELDMEKIQWGAMTVEQFKKKWGK
jgi:hypothetical protein